MRAPDDRYRGEWRAFDLAIRFLRHEVRTSTITQWTGLTPNRIRKLYRNYIALPHRDMTRRQKSPKRHRGKSPYKLEFLLQSPLSRHEITIWAGICQAMRLVPSQRLLDVERALPGLERGHVLCEAYERLHRDYAPGASLSMEQAILVLQALTRGDEVQIGTCAHCHTLRLIDRLSGPNRACPYCRAGSVPPALRSHHAEPR